jgi:hypothetical protein
MVEETDPGSGVVVLLGDVSEGGVGVDEVGDNGVTTIRNVGGVVFDIDLFDEMVLFADVLEGFGVEAFVSDVLEESGVVLAGCADAIVGLVGYVVFSTSCFNGGAAKVVFAGCFADGEAVAYVLGDSFAAEFALLVSEWLRVWRLSLF